MNIRHLLRRSIKKAIKKAQTKGVLPDVRISQIKIEAPGRVQQGDYSTAVSMQIASLSGRKPKTIAKFLQKELENDAALKKYIDDIRVASPGFINFYLSQKYLQKLPGRILNDDYGKQNIGSSAKINLEFVSINPTGELHVGHARAAFYGDVLANIFAFSGFKVTREYYVNNARQSAQIKELGKTALGQGTSYKSPYLDKKIKKYHRQLVRLKSFGAAGHFLANKIQQDVRSFLVKGAGISFDIWFEEEKLYKTREIDRILRVLRKKGLVYEKDEAVWLKTKRYGDVQDQVLVRRTGEHTYFLADIAYHHVKAKRGYKTLIDIWGADHQGHVKRMQAAMRMLGILNLEILITQLVRFKGGEKLSKRKGNAMTIEGLVEFIGLDATRFFYLTKSLDSQMEFDIRLARSQSQKNPIYYIQYTHARTCSIIKKANSKWKIANGKTSGLLKEEGELNLLRKLNRFPDVIEDTTRDYQVHRLASYVFELAQEFNQFYRDYKVLVEDEALRDARLALTITTGLVIKQSLDLLGIKAPERM